MKHFTAQFKNKTILVVGDVMIDEYLIGTITRMSPEAPQTPVILMQSDRCVLGGAANVANNIVSLGGKAILLGVVGDDENGQRLAQIIKKSSIKDATFVSGVRPTTTKTRLFDGARQVARIDREDYAPLSKKELALFQKALAKVSARADMVIVSDYAKGMISRETMRILRKHFPGDRIVADPKPVHKDLMRGLRAITPNLKEVSLMAGVPLRKHDDVRTVARALAKKLGTSIVTTMAREGMMVCDAGDLAIHRVAAPRVRAIDVTGAGDVATAALALALAAGATLVEAAEFANHAAGVSVTKPGTTTVRLKEVSQPPFRFI